MFNKIDCLGKTIWRTIRRFVKTLDTTTVEGHNYEVTEKHENVTVEISVCKHCGKVDIGWWKEERPLGYEDYDTKEWKEEKQRRIDSGEWKEQ